MSRNRPGWTGLTRARSAATDYFNAEVYVYEEEEDEETSVRKGHLYVHHDFLVPDFVLSMEWNGRDPTAEVSDEATAEAAKGSFLAVATATPAIEIWDLNLADAIEPILLLGGAHEARAPEEAEEEAVTKKKKKKKKKKKPVIVFAPGSHQDSVMGLAWNPEKQ